TGFDSRKVRSSAVGYEIIMTSASRTPRCHQSGQREAAADEPSAGEIVDHVQSVVVHERDHDFSLMPFTSPISSRFRLA
ncbi:MAG: hypothetical protein ACRDUV_10505, partial [Pseudonocardiaceae bacterium]